MKKLAIVTGSNGLIGSQSVKFLIEKDYHVIGIDNDMRAYFFGEEASTKENGEKLKIDYGQDLTLYETDIRDLDGLKEIFTIAKQNVEDGLFDLDLIIHTAAQPSHDWAAKEPLTDFGINAVGTINMLEMTRQFFPKATFIFTSTNKVYGDLPNFLPGYEKLDTRWEVFNEDGSLHAIDETMSIDQSEHSVFGASKVAADVMVQEYGRYWKMNTAVFRGGCLTGPQHAGTELHGFLSYLIKCIVHDKHYNIFGDGYQVRDNIHSWDLVNMFWNYHQNPSGHGVVYNAGGGRDNSTSILEAINRANELRVEKGLEPWTDYTILEDQWRIGDHIFYITDLSKFKKDYPEWDLQHSLDDIITQIFETEYQKRIG